ncbi:MAG: DUF4920 domain-containing protein [Acidobacteria bacterium]|nr:DUF4920 domain-containing protein [Acidobacteriota bacterium]
MSTKKLLSALALAAACAATGPAQEPAHKDGHKDGHKTEHKEGHGKHGPAPEGAANVTPAPGEIVRRGAPIGGGESVDFAALLKEPAKYAEKTVVVEGVVERVCQKQGCWMELAPEKGARGVRVAMKDHSFAVPFNSAGLRARAEGVFTLKTLTKEDADHFEKEGAKLKRNADGTADELSFTATGVELRK